MRKGMRMSDEQNTQGHEYLNIRWKPYKDNSNHRRKGIVGRWQIQADDGWWKNAPPDFFGKIGWIPISELRPSGRLISIAWIDEEDGEYVVSICNDKYLFEAIVTMGVPRRGLLFCYMPSLPLISD